jgi:hypothetical protein
MSAENKSQPPQGKLDPHMELLEIRIDMKMLEAKQALAKENETRLREIARDKYEPRILRWQRISGVALALFIVSLIWGWFSLSDKIKAQADY